MKKIIGILLVSVIILSLAACKKVSSNEISSISSNDNTVSEIEETNDITSSDITEEPVVSSMPQATTSTNTSSEVTTSTQTSSIVSSVPAVSNDVSIDTSDTSSVPMVDLEQSTKIWFVGLYNTTQQRYVLQLKADVEAYKTEKSQWTDLCEQYRAEKYVSQIKLQEQYANMGLLNSGAYQSALSNSNYQYDQKISECTRNIAELNSIILEIESEIENPNPNEILAIIAVENGYTADEVVDYYNKYMVE